MERHSAGARHSCSSGGLAWGKVGGACRAVLAAGKGRDSTSISENCRGNNGLAAAARLLSIADRIPEAVAGARTDLKTFQELATFGVSVVTAVTAQNSVGVGGVYPMSEQARSRSAGCCSG